MIIELEKKKYVVLICQKLNQPIGKLYTSSVDWKVLHYFAFADTRVLTGFDDEGKEQYRGIQRILSEDRQKEIKKYVHEFEYATFPTSIILNFPHEKIDLLDFHSSPRELVIKNQENLNHKNVVQFIKSDPPEINQTLLIFPFEKSIAQIIDGQHRLSGFSQDDKIKFDLPVTIFVDQIVEDQAEIFSTINGKQTRVTPSLVYELFGISIRKSPYKSAHEITKILNDSELSPIRHWIKRLGKSNDHYEGYITQSTVNKNLFLLISGNAKQAEEDMRTLARKEDLELKTPFSKRNPDLRKYFISGDDEVIAKVIMNFYSVIKDIFNVEWDSNSSILKRTVGFNATFKVMLDLIKLGKERNDFSKDFFNTQLMDIKNVNFNVQLSSKGVNELYDQFKNQYTNNVKNLL